MKEAEAAVLAGLAHFPPAEKIALWELASDFPSPFSEDLILSGAATFSDSQAEALRRARTMTDAAAAQLEKLRTGGGRMLTFFDEDYPPALRGIEDPPFAVFVRGRLPDPAKPAAAIVGARACTAYGIAQSERFAAELAGAGIGIVSGLAFGVDAAAHRGALQAGGYTLAVLGCGIDICYPKENYFLQEAIEKSGGILSEYPPGSPPHAYHFPQRNRLISAFSSCILVMEARLHSGSLITAGHALAQNRDVFALPGRINDPLSEGTNLLIEQGAGILLDADSVIRRLCRGRLPKGRKKTGKRAPVLTDGEQALLRLFDTSPITVSDLCAFSGLPASEVSLLLAGLAQKDCVREAGPGYFEKIR